MPGNFDQMSHSPIPESRRDPQTVHFHSHPRESIMRSNEHYCACPNYTRRFTPRDVKMPLLFSYRTQYRTEYGQHNSGIQYTRRPPPTLHEQKAEQVSWEKRKYDPPMQTITSNKGTHGNDGDRGYHEWRQLMPRAGDCIWQPLERNLFWRNSGKTRALPLARLIPHNPMHQKARWETIKQLDASECLSYGYRKHIPGYAGHVNMSEHAESDIRMVRENKAMESTVQASYREHPDNYYNHGISENANKHKGPLSRMVTLTHPFNPFTQQSAFSNMGAKDTTSNCCK